MNRQCINPYLPLYEHIPDGEPHVFGDRLYVYGSHDMENGNEFCELDYVVWSAPTADLSDWRYDGVIYRKDQDPYNADQLPMYAPDVVQGPDGRYYLYYCIKFQDSINVAVCDRPDGEFQFYGRVHYADGSLMTDNQPYDPSLICCAEGNFLYFGFAPCMINIPRYKDKDLMGGSVLQLEDDMLTVKAGPEVILPSLKYGKGTSFEGNEYFEGPSIRKINNRFYLIYSSVHTHQLCYADCQEYGRYHGYTYLDKKGKKARYDFGHGLSYTEFSYSNLRLKAGDDSVEATFTLKNIGKMESGHSALLFVSAPGQSVDREKRLLKGFERVFLKAGESMDITISCSLDELKYYDEESGDFLLEPGTYKFQVGDLTEEIELNGKE